MRIRAFAFIALLLLVAVAGCQSTQTTEVSGATEQMVPLVPYSKGPTGPPGVKGPGGPPPGVNGAVNGAQAGAGETPQAVTETETVRYALPSSPTVEVKQ